MTLGFFLSLLLVGQAQAPASPAPQAGPGDSALVAAGAPVMLFDDTLFMVYGTLGPFGPRERASAAGTRIRRWLGEATAADTADSLAVVEHETYAEIVAGETVLLTVLEADARALGLTRAAAAARYVTIIQGLGASRAQQFTLKAILLGIAYAVAATAILVLLFRLLSNAFGRLYRKIEAQRAKPRMSLRIQRFDLVPADKVVSLLLIVARGVRWAIVLLLLYVYVPLVLSFFPWTQGLSRRIVGYAVTPLVAAWTAFVSYLPNVFYVLVIVLITRLVLKALRGIFDAIGQGSIRFAGFHEEWAEPTYKIVRMLVLVLTVVVVFPYLPGANTDAFKGVSLFIGVLLSLGSSAAVGNMVAGTVLTYTRSFRPGDRVRIGDVVGDVTERSLLVTRLRTLKNEEVTIPNGAVLGGTVTNYSALNASGVGLILHTSVTIGYDVNWRQVQALLLEAAKATADILPDPAPFVLQTSLDDFYVAYELNAATDRPDRMPRVYSDLHANIQDSFARAGVEIMSPHYRGMRDGNKTTIPPAIESG